MSNGETAGLCSGLGVAVGVKIKISFIEEVEIKYLNRVGVVMKFCVVCVSV